MQEPLPTIYVVDDDEGVRQTVAEILRRAQHTVAEAGDGEQALHRLEELVVRALVVDVRMPRLDGLALLQMLDHPPPVHTYPRGSWGPEEAAGLVRGSASWHTPWLPDDSDKGGHDGSH